MSIKNSANGSAKASLRPVESALTPKRTAGISQDAGHILAQIPSVETQVSPKSTGKRWDGRIISQTTSMKMVFGVAIGLVAGAILPFFFGRGSHSQPVKELPAWNAHGDQATAAPATAQTVAPAWTGSPASKPAVVVQPQLASIGISPPPTQVGDYRPAALSNPSWSRPQSPAPPAGPQQQFNGNQNLVHNNPLPGRGGDPRALQADNRSDPSAAYRNDPSAGYRNDPSAGYRNDPSTGYRNDPSAGYRNDPRYDYRNDNSMNPPPATRPAAVPDPRDNRYNNTNYPASAPQQGSPLMPAGGYGAGGSYRDQPGTEPGVARFEGNITNPPGRTN